MGEIYKITNNITGKIYIGKTKRKTRDRWLEHIRDAKHNQEKNVPLHKAIIKYGEDNFSIEILEHEIKEEDLNNKEKYYIKKFNSTNSSIGYNATVGGDGGKTSNKLSNDEIEQIKNILLNDSSNISLRKIAEIFNVTLPTIRAINNGDLWYDDSLNYPIRNYDAKATGINKENYEKIVFELKNLTLSLSEISNKYDVSVSTISSINHGRYCYNNNNFYYNNIYDGNYPIRETNHKVEYDFNAAFYEVLFTNKSIMQIEKDLGIHFNGLRYIVLGKRRKELTKDYILPMREHIEENQNIWNKLNGGNNNEICSNKENGYQ